MSKMYQMIEDFCNQKKINITQMCRDLNIPRSALSELKAERTQQLSLKYATKIADYFGVSIDDLLGRNEGEKKEPSLDEQLDGVELAFRDGLKGLNKRNKQAVLNYLRFLQQEQEKEGHGD